MFWKKDKDATAKLSGPRDIPEVVKKYIASTNNIESDTLPFLKAVTKKSDKGDRAFDIRVFDPADAEAWGIKITDYNSLTSNPDLIIAEGWYDEATKKTEINILRQIPKPSFLKAEQIEPQIAALKDPGSSVFYYMAAGPGTGGPLGRGASVVTLNPPGEKKQKKYTIYGTNVIKGQPDEKKLLKIWDSDKPKDIAKWLAEAQKPRFC